jgi:hypothetical protein
MLLLNTKLADRFLSLPYSRAKVDVRHHHW